MLSVVGEFGAVVAPASRNALFAAVGVRLRYLPIHPAAVPEALGHAWSECTKAPGVGRLRPASVRERISPMRSNA